MLLHVLIVIKQHSLISPETKVCILGSPCTCDIFFLSIRQRYRESPGPKTWTSWLKNLVPICLYCLKCTKFGQLILRKIIEIVATRCQILRLKCTKFNFGWVSAPDPAGGAYSAPRYPLAGFKGPTSEGREREGRGKGEGMWRGPESGLPRGRAGSRRACQQLRPLNTTSGFLLVDCIRKVKVYHQTEFRWYKWDITTSVFEKQTSAILEFYFRFRFRPFGCNLHIILQQQRLRCFIHRHRLISPMHQTVVKSIGWSSGCVV